MQKITVLLLGLLLGWAQAAQAQTRDTNTMMLITTHAGVEYTGRVILKNAREVYVALDNGDRLYIPTYQIASIVMQSDALKTGHLLADNPHASRYFYTPSALPIKRGDGYVQSIYGAVWQFQYGMTDRFSIGIGTPLIGAPIWITPKYSMQLGDKTWAAIGAQMGSLGWIQSEWGALLGIGYAVVTRGDQSGNLSFGVGYYGARIPDHRFIITDSTNWTGYEEKVYDYNAGLAFSLCGMKQLRDNMFVIGEFWLAPQVGAWGNNPPQDKAGLFFGGPGLRVTRGGNLWDFGFWVFSVTQNRENTTFPIPYIAYTWKLL
jgi:hypothetical protein